MSRPHHAAIILSVTVKRSRHMPQTAVRRRIASWHNSDGFGLRWAQAGLDEEGIRATRLRFDMMTGS